MDVPIKKFVSSVARAKTISHRNMQKNGILTLEDSQGGPQGKISHRNCNNALGPPLYEIEHGPLAIHIPAGKISSKTVGNGSVKLTKRQSSTGIPRVEVVTLRRKKIA